MNIHIGLFSAAIAQIYGQKNFPKSWIEFCHGDLKKKIWSNASFFHCFSCLRQALTQILAGLMEVDPGKSMSFDLFFQAADDILEREVVYLFSTTSARHFTLYLKKDSRWVVSHHSNTTTFNLSCLFLHFKSCFIWDIWVWLHHDRDDVSTMDHGTEHCKEQSDLLLKWVDGNTLKQIFIFWNYFKCPSGC